MDYLEQFVKEYYNYVMDELGRFGSYNGFIATIDPNKPMFAEKYFKFTKIQPKIILGLFDLRISDNAPLGAYLSFFEENRIVYPNLSELFLEEKELEELEASQTSYKDYVDSKISFLQKLGIIS